MKKNGFRKLNFDEKLSENNFFQIEKSWFEFQLNRKYFETENTKPQKTFEIFVIVKS